MIWLLDTVRSRCDFWHCEKRTRFKLRIIFVHCWDNYSILGEKFVQCFLLLIRILFLL